MLSLAKAFAKKSVKTHPKSMYAFSTVQNPCDYFMILPFKCLFSIINALKIIIIIKIELNLKAESPMIVP